MTRMMNDKVSNPLTDGNDGAQDIDSMVVPGHLTVQGAIAELQKARCSDGNSDLTCMV
jgi:hypothetical protein